MQQKRVPLSLHHDYWEQFGRPALTREQPMLYDDLMVRGPQEVSLPRG